MNKIGIIVAVCLIDLLFTVSSVFVKPAYTEEDVLRIGITPNTPPIIYKDKNDIVGVEADLARKLAAELGKSPKFISLKWEDQIPALLDGRTDIIMSGMTITELRSMRINFSQPYLKIGQMALIRLEDVSKYRNPYAIDV